MVFDTSSDDATRNDLSDKSDVVFKIELVREEKAVRSFGVVIPKP